MSASTTSASTSILWVEALATVVPVAIALCLPRAAARWTKQPSHLFTALARRRRLSIFIVGAAAFCLRLAILPFSPIPKPVSLPDFSFLLAADTFSSGRLTNPPPPLWPHFESFHITVFPTYMSMYFPAQGLALAAGKILTGNPWFGVLITTALMCAALCWMLQAWLPPKWALLGGVIAVLRLGLFSCWIDTYNGGSVAALGGALVMGALPRIWREFRSRDFLWMAIGISILANSRPYEGLLVCVPAMGLLLWRIHNHPHPGLSILLRRCVPALLVLGATFVFIGYYNHQVFGSVFTPPYKVNREMYASAPHFLWQKPRPEPIYRHEVMRDFYSRWELGAFLKARTFTGLLAATVLKVITAMSFFLGVVLLLPFAMLPRAACDKRMRELSIVAIFVMSGLAAETWLIPHYMAPATAVLYAILLQCMRHMNMWRYQGQRAGAVLIRTIPVVCVALCCLRLYAEPLHLALAPAQFSSRAWFGTQPAGLERDRVLVDLEARPGKQLVLVRYSPHHSPMDEWVYNAADIDGSKVVWAREMTPGENAKLLQCYPNRAVWLVQPDLVPAKLSRYEETVNSGTQGLAGNYAGLKHIVDGGEHK